MDVNRIVRLAMNMSEERNAQAVSIAVLKKAMDIDAQNAQALIDALPSSSHLPAHLGQNVNTVA